MSEYKNQVDSNMQPTNENKNIDQLNSNIQALQSSLLDFFVKLPLNPIDQCSCEILVNNISTLQVSLESYLSWLKLSKDKSSSLKTYREFLYQKLNKSPEQAVIDACKELQFLVNSVYIFEDLIKYYSFQDVLNSSFEQNLPEEARKEIAVSFQMVTSRLIHSGVSDELLMPNENNPDYLDKTKNITCPIEDIIYKKIKDGIRIDEVKTKGEIVLPDFIDGLPVVRIGANTFSKRQDVTAIFLPKYLVSIEENAFAFTNITSIVIPNGVETIGEKAFYSCKKLESVILPENLKHIKGYAFEKCESIVNISIPSKTTYIGNCAFNQCKNLKGIKIPISVSRIGYSFIPKNTIVYCDKGSRAERYIEESYGMKKKPYNDYNQDFCD